MRASLFTSAFVAVIVGFGGSVAIVLAGADGVGATAAQKASWVTALCLAMFATSAGLSWAHRKPIVTAWSTPGAALIGATAVAGTPTIGIEAAVGAFLLAGALVMLSAAIKPLADAIAKIPTAIAAAMLAGVLLGFSVAVFDSARQDPLLVLPLVGLFLIVRAVSATWAVIVVLVAGVAWSLILGRVSDTAWGFSAPTLEWITPEFDPTVLVGLGLPLFLVSMASQNLPGFAVLRAAGYEPPTRSSLAATGLASVLTAPFGGHTATMAAITASLCTGPDTHPDADRRWPAGIVYGFMYLGLAVVGVTLVAGFANLPSALIVTIAGLALLGALTGALGSALGDAQMRAHAVLTIVVTASSLSLFGIGSAFWGLAAGLGSLGIERLLSRRTSGN